MSRSVACTALLACFALISAILPSLSAAALFDSAICVDIGKSPHVVAIGDLNSDGRADLAMVDDYSVFVILSRGHDTFETVAVDSLFIPYAIALEDVDRDGRPDLLVADSGGNRGTVRVYRNEGGGVFQPPALYTTAGQQSAMAAADLNGDGSIDIIVSYAPLDHGLPGISVLLGNGDGTFRERTDYTTGAAGTALAIADVNGDGVLDLVTANQWFGTASVLLGNGDGSFRAKTDYPVGREPVSVAVGDLNADGIPDLVTANSADNGVAVLLGASGGVFGSPSKYPTGAGPTSVAIVELNHDGVPDLLTADGSSNTVSVLPGRGDGTFAAGSSYGTRDWPRCVVVGDMNGDPNPDVVTANGSGSVSVLLAHADGTLASRSRYATGARWVAVGDLNRDGRADLVATNRALNRVSVLLGDGRGGFLSRNEYPTGTNPYSVAIGDVNRDGKPDLVTANYGSGTASVLMGNGDGTFGAKVDYPASSHATFATVADLNLDGNPDLATVSVIGTWSLLLGNGDGTFRAKTDHPTTRGYPASLAIGDLNGDGKPDVAWGSHDLYNVLSVSLGNGDGTFQPTTEYAAGNDPGFVSIGDLNGDGTPDLVCANGYSNTLSVFIGSGNGAFRPGVEYATGAGPFCDAIADVNGDGIPDLIAGNFNSSTASVLLGRGDGTFDPRQDYLADRTISIATGDFDSDGKPDLVTCDMNGSIVSVLRNIAPSAPKLHVIVDLDPNVINLKSHSPWVTALLEPEGFDATAIDLSSLRLAGVVHAAPKLATIGDRNVNGTADLTVKFSREELDPLLTPGVDMLEVTGSLVTGESFQGSDTIRVIQPGHTASAVAPNPMNPVGRLTFATDRSGRVRVDLFDAQGRLVRTVTDGILPVGDHAVTIDGRDGRGRSLATGIYFYRIESTEGRETGRLAIIK